MKVFTSVLALAAASLATAFSVSAQTGVGIGVTSPQKPLHIDANSDFLRIDNLSPVSNTNNYLVIDGSGNVGKTTVENVAGQIMRLGLNGASYFENAGTPAAAETGLRFNSHSSAALMGNAPNGAPNFVNTITGATLLTGQTLVAGTGTPARTTDRIQLPAGVYRVTVRLCGNYISGSGPAYSAFVKFIVNNKEYSLVTTLANDAPPSTFNICHAEVSDYLNLTSASTVDFTINPYHNFTLLDRASPDSGVSQSYRSLVLIERLR